MTLTTVSRSRSTSLTIKYHPATQFQCQECSN